MKKRIVKFIKKILKIESPSGSDKNFDPLCHPFNHSKSYLVVSPNKKRANYWWKQLVEYLAKEEIRFRYYEIGKTYVIDICNGSNTVVKFCSEYSFYEVLGGHRGYVVDEYQVQDWLEAAAKGEDDG